MKTLRTLLIYVLLAGGSLVFVWPFLWMAATSAKLDRELFSESLTIWPERPIPRLQSPYLDDRLFEKVRGPHLEEAVGVIEKELTAVDYSWPAISRVTNCCIRRRAAFMRDFSNILPGEGWELPIEELRGQNHASHFGAD